MVIAALIGIMMAILVGISLIPAIIGRPEVVEEGVEVVEGTPAILNVLVIVFVAVMVLGAVAWMGFEGGTSFDWLRRWISGRPNPKSLEQYFSYRSYILRADRENLGEIIGVKSELVDGTGEDPLQLRGTTLVFSKEFHWFLDEKHLRYTMYKLVGLHQRRRNLNSAFILGSDANTRIPYLLRLPPNYLEQPLEDCIRWCMQAGKGDVIKEV